MAYEATLIFETEHPIPFTVADGTGIEKGTLLKMTDPMTAAITAADADVIAGIASTEKIASDGVTKVGVYRKGIFKMTITGACVAGDALMSAATAANDANTLKVYNQTTSSGARIVGTALETGAAGDTILVDLNIV